MKPQSLRPSPPILPRSLPWAEPLALAATIDEPYWVLLYSGNRTHYSGRYSYLACHLAERIEADSFAPLEARLAHPCPAALQERWFGLLGYDLKNTLERLPEDKPDWIGLPPLCMMRFHHVYQFDHETRTLTLWSDDARPPLPPPSGDTHGGYIPPRVLSLDSPMPDEEYLQKAARVIELIHKGELYQSNLTRKYQGAFAQAPDYFSLFRNLCEVSPAPYSAYLRLGDTHILSSSPELFLSSTPDGYMETRPIKGTAPRFDDKAKDELSRAQLMQSVKDRAENLMIVDLMRNDLAHSCLPGSIEVGELFAVTSHATIHHMSSLISGQKAKAISIIGAIKGCFPPGSMTGAPKIRAMQLCSELETFKRGVYGGAIGWLDRDGSCELSVVIRTLLIKGARFEYQVGGGIVADSTPEAELLEILFKSKGILKSLHLPSR